MVITLASGDRLLTPKKTYWYFKPGASTMWTGLEGEKHEVVRQVWEAGTELGIHMVEIGTIVIYGAGSDLQAMKWSGSAGFTAITLDEAEKERGMAKAKDVLLLNWKEIEQVLGTEAAQRVLLMGPPGTGKTWAGNHPPKGRPVFQTTLTDETPAAELRGHYVPHGQQFVWHDGPAIAAWRAGGRLVLNEVDHASLDCMTFLHAVLDDPEFATLTLPSLDVVKPAAGFSVVATMNADTPEVLNDALADRFAIKIYVADVNPKALAALPKDLQVIASKMANVKEAERRIGLRAWMAYAAMREEVEPELAGKAVFGARWQDMSTAMALDGARVK